MDAGQHILQSWQQNAGAWANAIANNEIESRQLVTNAAIVEALCRLPITGLWDAGCGEGWLCRAMASRGVPCLGTDAIPDLVQRAQLPGGARYEVATYQQIVAGTYRPSIPVNTVVFNFALFENEQVHALLATLPGLMGAGSYLVIQTLHPHTACGHEPYADGWRTGSWQGFSESFVNPAPWYFRTMHSWVHMLRTAGYSILELGEPLHPHTGRPASLILVASC